MSTFQEKDKLYNALPHGHQKSVWNVNESRVHLHLCGLHRSSALDDVLLHCAKSSPSWLSAADETKIFGFYTHKSTHFPRAGATYMYKTEDRSTTK